MGVRSSLKNRRSTGSTVAVLAAGALLLSACGGGDPLAETESEAAPAGGGGGGGGGGETIVVGGADFTESLLMIEMYAALLEDAGYSTETQTAGNRELYAVELEAGRIHVVPEYAATMAEFLNLDANGPDAEPVATSDAQKTVTALRELAEPQGLEALEPAEAANQNAFFVTEAYAEENGLTTLSDLGAAGVPVVLAGTEECPDRPKCLLGLEEVYGIDVTENLPLGFGTTQNKEAVIQGDAQIGLSGTTDGTLESLGLVVLEDDMGLQNADNLVPVVNAESPGGTEEVAEVLNQLSEVLTTEDLAMLNAQVDEQRLLPEDVARDYLVEQGLLEG